MKRLIITALCLALLAGLAAAQPNPWDPNYYTGTFRGHGDFVPKGNGVWDLGDPGNHWRKAYVDSLLGGALVGYADSSHRADSLLFQGSYISLSKYLYTNYNDTNFFFGRGCGNSSVSRYSNGFGYGALGSAGTLTLFSNAFGFEALKNIGGVSANGNHGFGHKVLTTLTAGVDNDGFGLNTMRDLQAGNNNSAFGDQALLLVTTGDQNSGFGQSVMLSADSCYKNAGFGAEALYNTIGTGNIGFGYQALYNNLRSNYRIGIGYQVDAAIWPDTLRQDTTIAIGFKASSDSQGISIGDSAVAMLKNSGALGNHVTSRLQNYFTILNIDSDTLRSSQGIILATAKKLQWPSGAYLKDTLGTRLRSLSVSFDSTWTDNVLPRTANTGRVGTSANMFNSLWSDSVLSLYARFTEGSDSIVFKSISTVPTIYFYDGASSAYIYYSSGSAAFKTATNITGATGRTVLNLPGGILDTLTRMTADTVRNIYILPTTGGKLYLGASTADTTALYGPVTIGGSNAGVDLVMASGSAFNINSSTGALTWSAKANSIFSITGAGVAFSVSGVGSSVATDTLSGYNGNTWAVSSWGITITGVDTLGKFYMASFDSLKMVRCWGSAKNASIGGSADTLFFVDSLRADSVKIPWGVGLTWLAPAVINKKWPTNPSGVLNPVYCIFRKGATTAAANLQVWTTYGLSKGRMF